MSLIVDNLKVKIDEYDFSYNFELEDGKILAILGPSGCGKTTLLNTISGLIDCYTGAIILDGKEIQNTPINKREIAYVFQDYALFENLSVFYNLAFPLKIRHYKKLQIKMMVKDMLEKIELQNYENRKVSTLSGGEKQRIAIARALLSFPKLLLLDEPLSSLDMKLRDKMRTFIKKIQRENNLKTIIVTHDIKDAEVLSDLIITLPQG